MNIEQAQGIPMSVILEKISCKPVKETAKDVWYLSPLRIERTPSFHINKKDNCWYDFGIGEGGQPVDFVCAYLKTNGEADTIQDALRWMNNMVGFDNIKPLPAIDQTDNRDTSQLQLKSIGQLKHFGLNHYLKKRGIPEKVGYKYLKEIRTLNKETLKTIIALGLKNEENGYELRNPLLKSSIGAKSITFIRGSSEEPKSIHIFEGMFDFLSIVTLANKPLVNDSIILNSNSLINKALPYIKNYGYKVAYTWLDNDEAGLEATRYFGEFFRSEENLVHKKMNKLYEPFNDVNAWHMNKLNLNLSV